MTGVRRILDNAAHRALAAGPPSKAQEAAYAATWAATTPSAACALLAIARWLSR